MPKAPSALILMIATLLTACGGGGGGGGASSPPPASPPPPPPPPAVDTTLAASQRPVSAQILCSNGLARRAAASSANRFDSLAPTLGIDHWHNLAPAEWAPESDRFEGAMRTGAVVAGDFNGDCWPDLIFASGATSAGQLLHYANHQGNGFARQSIDVAFGAGVIAGLGTADLDGDYRPDLVLGNLLPGQTQVYLATASGGFALTQSIAMARSTFGFAFGDYSGDDRLDLIAAHWDRTPLAGTAPFVLRNTGVAGAGLLAGADASAGTTPASLPQDFHFAPGFVDLNQDQRPDLLVTADATGSIALQNTGAGSFSLLADGSRFAADNAAGTAIADFDNDGHWDWFVAGLSRPADARPWPWGDSGSQLYWGEAASPFLGTADTAAGIADADWPAGVCAADFNNDGLTDLFVENGFGFAPAGVAALLDDPGVANEMSTSLADRHFSRARLFINQGNRTFVDESLAWGITELTGGRGVACLDFDRDGDIDIAVAQNSRPAVFHVNRHSAADGNPFVAVRLTSIPPNSFAVGAVVSVEAGGRTQRRQVAANSGFLGQGSLELHFGLGAATAIDRITVDWADGVSSSFSDLAANRFYSLTDPRFEAFAASPRRADVGAALSAAHSYIANNSTLLPDDAMTSLSWAQRIYGITLPYSPADVLMGREQQYDATGSTIEAAAIRAFLGLVIEGRQLSPADFASLQGLNAITMRAVFCHQYPFDDAYIDSLEALVPAGGYDTTHALLTLMWAIDNDCALPASYDPQLFDDTIRAVYAIAAAHDIVTDLRVEAMAFMAAAGRLDLIRPVWLAQLLDAQEASGAWKDAPADAQPSGHTTALAYWFLLQLAENGKVASRFVPQSWEP